MVISTYQAASGAGQAAMDELELQTSEVLQGKKEITKNIFPFQVHPLCFCLPFWASWKFPLPALSGLLGAPFACPFGPVERSLCLPFRACWAIPLPALLSLLGNAFFLQNNSDQCRQQSRLPFSMTCCS